MKEEEGRKKCVHVGQPHVSSRHVAVWLCGPWRLGGGSDREGTAVKLTSLQKDFHLLCGGGELLGQLASGRCASM